MHRSSSVIRAAAVAAFGVALSVTAALAQGVPAATGIPATSAATAPTVAPAALDILSRGTACSTPKEIGRLDVALPVVARKLILNEPVKVVALGSSSTAGAGASSPAYSYPSRLGEDLRARYPRASIEIVNRGVNGEEIKEMLARLDAVLADSPALVIWQMGTNSVLRDQDSDAAMLLALEGIKRIKAAGADLLLVDLQYAPRVLAKSEAGEMLALIDEVARVERLPVFHRFAVMRHWHDSQKLGFDAFITSDGLHLNDWGYACFARTLADAMGDAITRGQAMATAVPAPRP